MVNNLTENEIEAIFNADPYAIAKGQHRDKIFNIVTEQIKYLHFQCGLDSLRIATFFMIGSEENENFEKEKLEFIDYTELVIEKYKVN